MEYKKHIVFGADVMNINGWAGLDIIPLKCDFHSV